MSERIDILLATYQGGDYLEVLLESILTQTHPNIHLIVRDDGSTDSTRSVLKKYAATYPSLFSIVPSNENLGIKGNFSALMHESRAPYVMFADQDDRWLPHKIESSLEALKGLERQYGSHLPLLVHSDLIVVDHLLKEITPSFWNYAGVNPENASLNRLVVQNGLTGCTMMMNRSLIELAAPIPKEAIMHDWWIALVAASFGHIHPINQPTILYRQHLNNDTGAKPYTLRSLFNPKPSISTIDQANALLARYEAKLSPEQKQLLEAYVSLPKLSYFNQKKQMLRYQFYKQGFLRNVHAFLSSSPF